MHHGFYLSFLRTNQLSKIHYLIAMISKMQGDVVNFVIEICVKLSSIKRRLEEQYSTNNAEDWRSFVQHSPTNRLRARIKYPS